ACAKALGTGFRKGVFFRDMGVVNLQSGKPTLRLTGGALKRLGGVTPAGHAGQSDLAVTPEYPPVHAFVVLFAMPPSAGVGANRLDGGARPRRLQGRTSGGALGVPGMVGDDTSKCLIKRRFDHGPRPAGGCSGPTGFAQSPPLRQRRAGGAKSR